MSSNRVREKYDKTVLNVSTRAYVSNATHQSNVMSTVLDHRIVRCDDYMRGLGDNVYYTARVALRILVLG